MQVKEDRKSERWFVMNHIEVNTSIRKDADFCQVFHHKKICKVIERRKANEQSEN